MKLNHPAGRKPRIEMLPLIDIVFLLLVFFIYAMLSMAVHRGLPVDLPRSATAEKGKELPLAVTVTADGAVQVNKEAVPLARLTEVLQQKAAGPETGVLLFADRSLSYQRLFAVLDRIRKAGLARISLQADADAGP